MNPRHAAALALVGWYLMVPRVSTYGGKTFVDSHASVERWVKSSFFRSAVDCEKARVKSLKNAQGDEDRNLEEAARADANLDDRTIAGFKAARLGICVSEDDPRLKEK
jgi:hypothetical protein